MCGLCGELRFDASVPDQTVIERMKEKLQKRGPDSEGSYVNAPIALVFKGMIYNYPDLRAAS